MIISTTTCCNQVTISTIRALLKLVLPTLLFFTAVFPSFSFAEGKKDADKATDKSQIVAEINDNKITRERLDFEFQRRLGPQLVNIDKNQQHVMKKELLERMIERELLVKAAKSKNLVPTEEQVKVELDKIKAQSGSNEAFEKLLKDNSLDYEAFKSGISEDIAIRSYIGDAVFAEVKVNDDDTKKAFDQAPDSYADPIEVRARHILLKVSKEANKKNVAEVKKRAEDIYQKAIKDKGNFDKLAKEHSEGPTKQKGGDLGYFTKNQMVPPFANAAFALKKG